MDESTLERLNEQLAEHTTRLGEVMGPWRAENTRTVGHSFDRHVRDLGQDLNNQDPNSSSRESLIRLRGRVENAGRQLEGLDGRLEPETFEELTESVKRLTTKMDENVAAYNDCERGQPIDPSQMQNQQEPGSNPLGDVFESFMRRMPGGALGKLGAGGALVGGAFTLANMAEQEPLSIS